MLVLAINGSPKPHGNTAQALKAALEPIERAGIQTRIETVGGLMLHGCTGCGACGGGKPCVHSDAATDIIELMRSADGLLIGSPVYYGGISGQLKCLLDRAYYSGAAQQSARVCAGLVVQRRTGGMDALRQIENYFALASVYLVPTRYWSILHGAAPGEVMQDLEGIANARLLGERMAAMLRAALPTPPDAERARTNFIR